MDFPVHYRDVALQSDDEKISQRRRETDIQKSLAEKVLANSERWRHITCVEHEVHVRYACQEVRGSKVGKKVVEGVVKPLIGYYSSNYHRVSNQDEDAEGGADHLDRDEHGAVQSLSLTDFVVEELHALIIITVILSHFVDQSVKGKDKSRIIWK